MDEVKPAGGREMPSAAARPNLWRSRATRWTALALIGYVFILGMMLALENSLIFHPSRYPAGSWTPSFAFEDVWFTASDGTRLHGWYLPRANPRATVLFAHGNAGNLSDRADVLKVLADHLELAVMIFDYRGFGRSEGSPSEAGILSDARAARDWLAERALLSEAQIVLMGESLGGGVMVDLAASDGARGLILESTFSSLPEVAAYHFPWLPVKWLMRTQLNSAAKIHQYQGPLLQIHGDADTIVPISAARKLFEAANEPKTFVAVAGGDHNDPRTPAFVRAIDRFIGELAPLSSQP